MFILNNQLPLEQQNANVVATDMQETILIHYLPLTKIFVEASTSSGLYYIGPHLSSVHYCSISEVELNTYNLLHFAPTSTLIV